MSLTHWSLRATRLTFFAALLILLAGTLTFLGFPSQEEPSTTVRDALVVIVNPGLPAERLEQLVARPLEGRLRELPELKNVVSTVRSGSVITQVTLLDTVHDLAPVWQKMRAKVGEVSAQFPAGTLPAQINDDFGRVAVASIAITAPGFSMSEMREPIKSLRDRLYELPGVQGVSLHGLQDERIYLEFDRARLAALGLPAAAIVQQLQQQNVVLSGGQVVLSGLNAAVVASGELRSLQALREFVLALPQSAPRADAVVPTVRLADVARIRVLPSDPPESAAIYRDQDAVVLGVSMRPGQNVKAFGQALKATVEQLRQTLPAGFSLDYVTYQADVVAREMGKMNRVMAETIVIVMAVVVLFLGWRAGFVVGSIVPLTILATLLAMRSLGIELHTVSMAAIIIALGLLVDNGIVIAEDIERRLADGQERRAACIDAGRTLAIPLLTSSLVIIFAFSPFYFGDTAINEYLRPLVVVLALSLLGSWLLCLTVTPLLCYHFLRAPAHGVHGAQAEQGEPRGFYAWYARLIRAILGRKALFLGGMAVLLAGAMWMLSRVPAGFLPPSDRPQFQIALELQPGTDSRLTQATVRDISRWLSDPKINPEVTTNIGYVADGGPRIILGLNPPLPASHIGYFTVGVRDKHDLDPVIARAREWMLASHPEVRAEAKRFSMGASESGMIAYRISGPQEATLRAIGQQVQAALQQVPGVGALRDDWGGRVPRVDVSIDQRKARRLGITSEDIAMSLGARYLGVDVSVLRDGDTLVPIIARGSDGERARPEDLGNTLVHSAAGAAPVPLSALATVTLDSEPSVIRRRNLARTLTVEGRATAGTAQQAADAAAPAIAKITLPPGYRIEPGAEVEEAAEANQALAQFMPHAAVAMLLLFVCQFNSFRKLALILAIIPFAMIGVAPALTLAREPLGFMANFGLLSLAGIIVNNAVLLLERIEAELAAGKPRREAVVAAAVQRLRPIVMTKLTCVAGLVPLLLFGGALWSGMAVTIMGGLMLGTLVTLGLVPVLYEVLFRGPQAPSTGSDQLAPAR